MSFSVLRIHGSGSQMPMSQRKKYSKTMIIRDILNILFFRHLCKFCEDWNREGYGFRWKCSNKESVMGTRCRLDCWEGKHDVHNTTVECKEGKWMVTSH